MAVIEPAKPTVITAPLTAAPSEPRPAPMAPRPLPRHRLPPRRHVLNPPSRVRARCGPGTPMGRFPGAPSAPARSRSRLRRQAEQRSAWPNGGPAPAPSQAARTWQTLSSAPTTTCSPIWAATALALAGMGGDSFEADQAQDLGSYNAGALVNPDAGLSDERAHRRGPQAEARASPWPSAGACSRSSSSCSPPWSRWRRRPWCRCCPGSARLYAMMGMPVEHARPHLRGRPLRLGRRRRPAVLEVQGDMVNLTAGAGRRADRGDRACRMRAARRSRNGPPSGAAELGAGGSMRPSAADSLSAEQCPQASRSASPRPSEAMAVAAAAAITPLFSAEAIAARVEQLAGEIAATQARRSHRRRRAQGQLHLRRRPHQGAAPPRPQPGDRFHLPRKL